MIITDYAVRWIMLAFLLVVALLFFSQPLIPFIDLPNHLAEATVYKYHDAPGNAIAQYYQPTPWYFPNTFHTVFCSLAPDVETGNKVFHILCILLLQGALFLVIRTLGGNPWYGLLGVLFSFNYNMTFGFVGFAISIPTIILLFYVALRDIRENKWWLKLVASLLLVLLFLMHAQNALFGLLLYGLMMVYAHRGSWKKMVVTGTLVSLPLIMMIVAWWFARGTHQEESTAAYLVGYYLRDYFTTFAMRFRIVVFDNFQLREGMTGLVLGGVFFLATVLPLFWLRPWRNKRLSISARPDIYALIFLLTSVGCYLFLPDKLPGQTPLFQRFCTIVMLSFIIVASVWTRNIRSRAFQYFAIIAVVAYTALWSEYMYTFNRQNRNFSNAFFAGLDNQSRMAGLIYDGKYRGRKVYIHYPNYFLIWNKGIATSKIIDYRFGVVRRVASGKALPYYNELIGDGYRPLALYDDLEYLLVRGRAPVATDANVNGFVLLREAGPWKLYQNSRKATALFPAE